MKFYECMLHFILFLFINILNKILKYFFEKLNNYIDWKSLIINATTILSIKKQLNSSQFLEKKSNRFLKTIRDDRKILKTNIV